MNSVLKNKNIVVGITGSIAAYKAVEIIRLLRKKEAIIYPVMTRAATYFVHPLTFQTLSSQRVTRKMFKEEKKEIPHLSLAKLADLLLIAPATANIIGKIANGIADDILTTTVLATRAPVVIAPAMNYRMFRNPIFQTNMNKLKTFGFKFIGPEKGVLASGEAEIGRMVDPPRIVEYLEKVMNSLNDFQGKSFLITAGPTREPLDEVRFFSNYSSGKMGYALAEEGISRGAKIILISGPTFLTPPAKAEFYLVESAKDMEKKVMDNFSKVDGVSSSMTKHSLFSLIAILSAFSRRLAVTGLIGPLIVKTCTFSDLAGKQKIKETKIISKIIISISFFILTYILFQQILHLIPYLYRYFSFTSFSKILYLTIFIN